MILEQLLGKSGGEIDIGRGHSSFDEAFLFPGRVVAFAQQTLKIYSVGVGIQHSVQ